MRSPVPGDGALGVFLSPEVSQQVDRWRSVYLREHYEGIPPHITVVYPSFVRVEEWPSARPALVECLAQFQAFDITLKELGTFPGTPHVLWLKPEDGDHLSRIHRQLIHRFPHYVPPGSPEFVPHVTIGFFDAEEALSQAREAVQAQIKPLHFRVEELFYAVLGDEGVWRVHDRLPLGSPLTHT
jgi:2'-5' RNA ligase